MKISVVIGRFQVPQLHKGHVELLQHASREGKLVVLVGVSPIDGRSARCPLTFAQRVDVIRGAMGHDAIVLPLADRPTDAEWTDQLDRLLGTLFPQDCVALYVGAHPSIEPHYLSKTYPIFGFENGNHTAHSGTAVRAAIIESSEKSFMEGQIFALQRQYPVAYATVDIALVNDQNRVLLIQRRDTGEWGFPGGFVDPTDDSLEAAARRELYEETQMSVEGENPMTYLGSHRVNDWRYRWDGNKIITSFFMARYAFGKPNLAKDEVQDYGFLGLEDAEGLVCDAHAPLLEMLRDHLMERALNGAVGKSE